MHRLRGLDPYSDVRRLSGAPHPQEIVFAPGV